MSYFKGQGVAPDRIRAHLWLQLAAASGDKEAARQQALVAGDMTAGQLEAALRLARDWQARTARTPR
jgi:TPR repeat protein